MRTAQAAVHHLCSTVDNLDPTVAKQHVEHQFRLFWLLVEKLEKPRTLGTQLLLQIPSDVQRRLIERYYAIDEVFVREVVGKKFTHRLRRDLDYICARVNVSVTSALRQYDNCRRVYKCLQYNDVNTADTIRSTFLISTELAVKYQRIVFLARYKLNLSHKRLTCLTYTDVDQLVSVLLDKWTDGKTITMNVNFKDVRDLKALLNREAHEQYRRAVLQALSPRFAEAKLRALEPKAREIIKAILNIGAEIADSKELRDMCVDLVEKVADPCKAAALLADDTRLLLDSICDQFEQKWVSYARHHQRLLQSWRVFLHGISSCLVLMYDKLPQS
eukprot:TRINITY_DN2250_c1_g1_i4.p1 TRINITY_DN2250_c1_g1~~TRINITY_DN2250_c1_g1_i4.p1  ORF type:complete len:331 (-),score=115.68 TRINITY_DN2250_c1_g1_i4:932-1924(-)